MLGCGNSRLSADIFDDGFENMVNLDYSQVRSLLKHYFDNYYCVSIDEKLSTLFRYFIRACFHSV